MTLAVLVGKHFPHSGSWLTKSTLMVIACLPLSGSIQKHTLQVLGRILSCGYVFCGFIPIRISFPSLLCILMSDPSEMCGAILVDAFENGLSPVDAVVIKEAFTCRSDCFTQDLLTKVISVFSRFDCLEVPKPSNLLRLCEESARFMFVSKPFAAITEMAKGVPMQHRRFWNEYTIQGLYRVFVALQVDSAKVIDSIKEPLMISPTEQRVFGYLTQFVGCLKVDEVQKFLRFCTGSSVCIGTPITISFNSTSGLARRPIAHTCDCSLELSRAYSTYQEFALEFNCILSNEDNGWLIDAI